MNDIGDFHRDKLQPDLRLLEMLRAFYIVCIQVQKHHDL